VIPTALPVWQLDGVPANPPYVPHGALHAERFQLEDTPGHPGGLAQPQRAPGPAQDEPTISCQAKFVTCDDTIEEQLRDLKGCRFGLKLEWTQFRTPQYLARFTLLLGVALVLWTAVGQAVAEEAPSVRLPCKQKGPRLSLLHVGIAYLRKLARLVRLSFRFIQRHLPLPHLRLFAWLHTAGVAS